MIDTIGGRKTLALLLIMVVSIGVVLLKGDVPEHFSAILEFLFTGFVAGNVGEHFAGAMKAKHLAGAAESEAEVNSSDLPPPPEPIDLSPIEGRLSQMGDSIAEMRASNDSLASSIALVQQTLSVIINRTGIDKMPPR